MEAGRDDQDGTKRRRGGDRERTASAERVQGVVKLEAKEKKSLWVAYFLYICLGWTGMHHFYLGRDLHGVISLFTFGRFGLGLLLDFFALPTYVAQANEDAEVVEDWDREAERGPSRRSCRSCCALGRLSTALLQVCTASMFMAALQGCIPTDVPLHGLVNLIAMTIAMTTAFWMVGNIGAEKLDFKVMLVACFLCQLLLGSSFGQTNILAVYAAAAAACYYTELRAKGDRSSVRQTQRRNKCWRFTYIVGAMCLCSMATVGVVLMNAEVVNEHGQPIKLYDALKNFYHSPAWSEMKATFEKIQEEAFRENTGEEDDSNQDSRWERFFSRMKDVFDVDGEKRALIELGLAEDATSAQVKAAYRKLAKQYHPDRNRDNPEEATAKFMKIQEAYETLQRFRPLRGKSDTTDV